MGNHVRVLGILWIVWGAMGVLAGLAVLFFFGVIGAAAGAEEPEAFPIITGVGLAIFLFVVIISLPSLLAGYGLIKYTQWGRILTLILSFLNLPAFPLGTALGIYGIYVLFHDEGRRLFEPHPTPVES